MHTKESNQQLRAELKAAFPGIKFSVRMRGGAVNVKWIDGPTKTEVEEIANKYQNISYCEYTHEILSGGNSYVFCNRTFSEAVLKSAVDVVAAQWMRTSTKGEVWMTQEQRDQIEIAPEWDDVGFRIRKGHTFYDWTHRDFADEVYTHLKDISYFVAPAPKAKATKAEPEQVQSTAIATEAQSVTVTENDERDGVEIRFDSKPEQEVIESLKAAGFRWSRFNSCWYAKRNAETLAFAASLEAQAEPAPTEVQAEVHLEMLAIAPAIEEAEEWAPIEPIEVIQLELWGHVTYPKLNKNDTLESNNREIDDRSDTEECKVTEIVILSDKDYAQFCQSFLDDQTWLDGKGATESHNEHLCPNVEHFFELSEMHQQLWREGAYDVAIAVTTPTADHILIVNPQGYSYARYVGNPCDELKQGVRNAIAPAKATPAFLPQAIAQSSAYSGYTVVQEAVTYAPVVFSGRSPQQELKDKLAALNVDALDAEQISLLLKAIG